MEGDKVIYESNGSDDIIYTYDVDGTLISFHYDDAEYYYIRNLQNDIVKIIDNNGTIVVEYEYDAWGNILDISGSLANTIGEINPYRYRGYRYDEEIKLYYLNSRFYNPNIGRFINADGLLGQQGDILGHNMFAYTQNNPIMYTDSTGYLPKPIQDAGMWIYKKVDEIKWWLNSTYTSPITIYSSSESLSYATNLIGGMFIGSSSIGVASRLKLPFIVYNTKPAYEVLGKVLKGLGTALIVLPLSLDIANAWTANDGNTIGQRFIKTGVIIVNTGINIAVGVVVSKLIAYAVVVGVANPLVGVGVAVGAAGLATGGYLITHQIETKMYDKYEIK